MPADEHLEPVPETRQVLDELGTAGDDAVREALAAMAQRTLAIVPQCVGLSLGLLQEGLTFTLVSTGLDTSNLDAIQYLEDGPCLESQREAHPVHEHMADLLDEGRWAEYARLSAASGVASSLSLPIQRGGRVIGGINLYASTTDAFEGHHDELALALGAVAEGAVTNADLSFSTRLAAARAPEELQRQEDVDITLGLIATRRHVDLATAHDLLTRAAARAGITLSQAAKAFRHLYDSA